MRLFAACSLLVAVSGAAPVSTAHEGIITDNTGLSKLGVARTAADVQHGVDTRTDLEATTTIDGHSYARDFEAHHKVRATRAQHLANGVHAAGLHGRTIMAAKAAGSTVCSHVHCQHKIHNGNCGDGRSAEDCRAFHTSSVRVHHICSDKHARSDAEKKADNTCIEQACDAGHFCALDGKQCGDACAPHRRTTLTFTAPPPPPVCLLQETMAASAYSSSPAALCRSLSAGARGSWSCVVANWVNGLY